MCCIKNWSILGQTVILYRPWFLYDSTWLMMSTYLSRFRDIKPDSFFCLLVFFKNKFFLCYFYIKNWEGWSKHLPRLVFNKFLNLCRNIGNVKQKPTRKTCFPMKKATGFTHLQSKILPGGVSLKSTEPLLYFYKK